MKAAILAAGQGRRMLPLSHSRPKHMLELACRPLLEYTIKALSSNGIKDLILVVGHRAELIDGYFGGGEKFSVRIEYVQQAPASGTGAAVQLVEEKVKGDRAFIVIYGDLLISPGALATLLDGYASEPGNYAALVEVERPWEYGVVSTKGDEIQSVYEKPKKGDEPSRLALAGLYIFTPEVFSAIKAVRPSERGEVELTDAINIMAKAGVIVKGLRISPDEWLDVGRPWDLLEANRRILAQLEPAIRGTVEEGAKILGHVVVEEGAVVKTGSYIEGPAFIGQGSSIGPRALIRPATSVGRNVVIGASCEVKNSIILNGTHIPHLSYIGDSVIGERCNFGAGTITANLRLDEATIKVWIEDKLVDSGLRKLGAIVGDDVKTGVNVSLMPGVKIWPRALIGPGVVVYRDVGPGEVVLLRQELERRTIASGVGA